MFGGTGALGRAKYRAVVANAASRRIKIAGTASLVVSLPTVSVGIVRYLRRGAYADATAIRETVIPMAAGSVIGAIIGGLVVGLVPAAALKLGLGAILIVSAIRVFRHPHGSD